MHGSSSNRLRNERSWWAFATCSRTSRTINSCCALSFFVALRSSPLWSCLRLAPPSASPADRRPNSCANFPHQAFVLDHLAKPPIASGQREPWKRDLKELAQFPNVYCKLSGMVTEAKWKQWRPDEFTPYLDAVFEAFGASRLMIGSDWPVCTLSSSYSETIGIVLNYTAQLSGGSARRDSRSRLARIYGIDQASSVIPKNLCARILPLTVWQTHAGSDRQIQKRSANWVPVCDQRDAAGIQFGSWTSAVPTGTPATLPFVVPFFPAADRPA